MFQKPLRSLLGEHPWTTMTFTTNGVSGEHCYSGTSSHELPSPLLQSETASGLCKCWLLIPVVWITNVIRCHRSHRAGRGAGTQRSLQAAGCQESHPHIRSLAPSLGRATAPAWSHRPPGQA
eukprot:5355324-Amphidinium_carterae.1